MEMIMAMATLRGPLCDGTCRMKTVTAEAGESQGRDQHQRPKTLNFPVLFRNK
jgi:hypothetical protein